jgi:hypothetical protein
MANFKRGRPKNRRAGCLMCKPHKMNGSKDQRTKIKGVRVKINLKDVDSGL